MLHNVNSQYRQFIVHIICWTVTLMRKINEYSREEKGAYWALKGHIAQAKGDHLDLVHYD
jgi:hypothetical protein